MSTDEPNVLNFPAPPDGSWATTNLTEALPGVPTPLGWSIWARASDRAARIPFYAMGAIDEEDLRFPERSEDRVVNLLFGHIAIRVDYFCEMGDLVPGANGEAVARDAFGFVPPDYVSRRSRRRWPMFLARMPVTFLRTPGRVRDLLEETTNWYEREIPRTGQLDLAGARRQYEEGSRRFLESMSQTAVSIACVIQPVFTALSKLAEDTGVDATPLMRAQGSHTEAATIEDLWRVSREQMAIEEFVRRHGFMGPDVGEISSHSWREDAAPLRPIIAGYREMDEAEGPFGQAASGAAERERAEAELLAALPAARRPGARLLLRTARRVLPLRSVGKIAYARALDVARAAARRTGSLLAEDGVLDDPEDVFYLTEPELLGALPADLSDTVASRRELRRSYQALELPTTWTGPPEAHPVSADGSRNAVEVGGTVEGTGVSSGTVEARVRVVTDPADTELEPGEILVARTTDPSWASIMFLSSALVVDIGGQLSHAAVVAREVGVPCVMGTDDGTRRLRTGDLCRVDGSAGTVTVLERPSS